MLDETIELSGLTEITDEDFSKLARDFLETMTHAWMEPRTCFALTKTPVWGIEHFNPVHADEVWLWGGCGKEDRAIHAVRAMNNHWRVQKYSQPRPLKDSPADRRNFCVETDLRRFGLASHDADTQLRCRLVGARGAVFADSDEGERHAT